MQLIVKRRTEDGTEYLSSEGSGIGDTWDSERSEATRFESVYLARIVAKKFPGDGITTGPASVTVDRNREVNIPNDNLISSFLHCADCLKEKPANTTPQLWSQLDVGYTILGIQVWCRRHNQNVLHMDLQGNKFPANTEA